MYLSILKNIVFTNMYAKSVYFITNIAEELKQFSNKIENKIEWPAIFQNCKI